MNKLIILIINRIQLKNFSCKKLSKLSTDWTVTNNEYFPSKAKNHITYDFYDINTKSDVCIRLEFEQKTPQSNVVLDVSYINGSNKYIELFSSSLYKTSKTIDFCVRDFIYEIDEKFKVSFEISGIADKNWNEDSFILKNIIPTIKEFKTTKLIENWSKYDTNKKENPAFMQKWKSILPGIIASPNTRNTEYYINFQCK